VGTPDDGGSRMRRPWDLTLKALEPPLFVSQRRMAAARVGDDGGMLHVEPHDHDAAGRVVWRYVIEDGSGRELADDVDLRCGTGANVDPARAIAILVLHLDVAVESHRWTMAGQVQDDTDLFAPDVTEWAVQNEEALGELALDLARQSELARRIDGARRPFLRPIGVGGRVPYGWTVEPVGQWQGQDSEVVYRSRLYDVMVAPAAETEDREGNLAAAGWSYQGTDGYAVMWVRDRVAALRSALDRTPPEPPELGGRGL